MGANRGPVREQGQVWLTVASRNLGRTDVS
ncbi:hypothetical protein QFZ66_008140 [Streptomyces sp. B4I13]|nr:hypothetical protein [Streptomyces sp. B4I13]